MSVCDSTQESGKPETCVYRYLGENNEAFGVCLNPGQGPFQLEVLRLKTAYKEVMVTRTIKGRKRAFEFHGSTAMTERWERPSCELRQVVAGLTVRGVRHSVRKSALGLQTMCVRARACVCVISCSNPPTEAIRAASEKSSQATVKYRN